MVHGFPQRAELTATTGSLNNTHSVEVRMFIRERAEVRPLAQRGTGGMEVVRFTQIWTEQQTSTIDGYPGQIEQRKSRGTWPVGQTGAMVSLKFFRRTCDLFLITSELS